MNKIKLAFIGAAAITMASCNPCVTCTHPTNPDVEVCREEYEDQNQYETAVSVLEDFGGYTCN